MRKAGFTLLEMIVALAVAALMLTAIIGIGTSTLQNLKSTQTKLEQVQAIHATLDRLELDLSTYHKSFEGFGPWTFTFISTDEKYRPDKISTGLHRIGYEIALINPDDPENKSATLFRSTQDARLSEPALRHKILEAKSISIAYLNGNQAPFPAWPKGQRTAPLALRIIITDANDNEWKRLIPIPVQTP